MKRLKTAIHLSEVSFLFFTIKQIYILQPNRQRLPLAQETYVTLKKQFSYIVRLVVKCNLLWIDEYVMIDINLSLYLHRQRNSHLHISSVLLYKGHSFLSRLTVFKLPFVLFSLQHGHIPTMQLFLFWIVPELRKPLHSGYALVTFFFLTIWVWLCYVMLC